MAIVTRYFSTTGAGAADGTTWADRAALFSSGNWSSVITGFAFNGSDSLECRIEGGLTYTCSQTMASGLFANPPSAENILYFRACDNAGLLLDPPDPDWVSSKGLFSTSTLPVIATTTNISTVNLTNCAMRCLAFTASARAAFVVQANAMDWISVVNSHSNSASAGFGTTTMVTNSQVLMSGASFDYGISAPSGNFNNVRIDGSAATTSGNRLGLTTTSAGYFANRVTVIGCAGGGMFAATGAATRQSNYSRCLVVNCGTYGIQCNGAASQTVWHNINNCYIANCGTYGIDANGSRTNAFGNRLRDNTSGNFNGFGNYPTDSNYVVDSDDATEFVNAGSGDYRIKNTAAIWGKGFGPGDEPASGGGGVPLIGTGGLVY